MTSDVAVIDTSPGVWLARPSPMVPIETRAPTVEINSHAIALLGSQRDEPLHRSYLLARRTGQSGGRRGSEPGLFTGRSETPWPVNLI